MEGGGGIQQYNAPQAPRIARPPAGEGGAVGSAEKEVLDLQADAAEHMAAEKAAADKLRDGYVNFMGKCLFTIIFKSQPRHRTGIVLEACIRCIYGCRQHAIFL